MEADKFQNLQSESADKKLRKTDVSLELEGKKNSCPSFEADRRIPPLLGKAQAILFCLGFFLFDEA